MLHVLKADPVLNLRVEAVTGEVKLGTAGATGQHGVTPHRLVLQVRGDLSGAAGDVGEIHRELRAHEERGGC